MIRRPPRSPLFPSPTLFRSPAERNVQFRTAIRINTFNPALPSRGGTGVERAAPMALSTSVASADPASHETDLLALLVRRSEEHTSELQSQSNLVCRLLLEKK